MRRALSVFFALAVISVCGSGCVASRFAGGTASAFFAEPRKVEHRIERPVRADARLAALWVGHATMLIQMDDRFILTDPVFTPTVGMLLRRLVEPGIDPANLPKLDAVLVSHLHFDHFSLGSLETIESKVGMLVLPQGGTVYLTNFSFPSTELPTGRTWEKDGLRVTAVAVAHLGSRYGVDSAWLEHAFTGYVIEYHGLSVYFGGDSAYDDVVFADAGRRFPGIDLALLPISPLEPRKAMKPLHMNPADAVQAFLDLGAKRLIPMHYDTFPNPEDPPGGPIRELRRASEERVPANREVVPLAIGEQRVLIVK